VVSTLKIALQVGLPYGPLTLGIFLAFVVLSFPDLTVEGSFSLGGGVAAVLISDGHPSAIATIAAMGAGAGAGLVTALLHTRLRINPLLAGILTATGAWSVDLLVMHGLGDIGIADQQTLYNLFLNRGMSPQYAAIVLGAIACVVVGAFLVWFLQTEYGMSLRATGLDIQTARGMGVRTERRQVVGLMVANALAGLSGALVAQNDGFADVQSQVGVIVVGLAAVMIGRSLIPSGRLVPSVIGAILGLIVYRWVVSIALRIGLSPNYLQLVTASMVVIAIALRSHLRSLIGLPGTATAARLRRERIQFFEDDRVAPII
jgi:putative ABC transport system permease protein